MAAAADSGEPSGQVSELARRGRTLVNSSARGMAAGWISVAGRRGGRFGSRRAVAADREVHQPRVERLQRGVVEAEAREPAHPEEVLHDHVRPRQQATQHAAPSAGPQVQAKFPALVTVRGEEVGGGARVVGAADSRATTADPSRASRRPPAAPPSRNASAPRSPSSIVQYGPARTVLQSATRMPARGPGAGGAVIATAALACRRWYGARARTSRSRRARAPAAGAGSRPPGAGSSLGRRRLTDRSARRG